jgi:hypothetical protein
MKKQYLHLIVYACDECRGPVVSGSLGVRENEISRETDIREVGAICLSCGHHQNRMTEPDNVRAFPPVEWETANPLEKPQLAVVSRGKE